MDDKVKEIEGEYQNILDEDSPCVGFMIRTEHYKYLLYHIKELEDKLSQILIEKQIWERSSLDADDKIDELKEGIDKVLEWRNFDGDGISDPLREELYKLVEE